MVPSTVITTLFFLLLTPYALASINLVRPLAYQFPPVARVDQPYSWSFSASTFNSSSSGPLSYIALGLPPWLSFSPTTRTFTGSPNSSNVGSYVVQVTATSQDGQSSMSDHVTLTVSERSGVLNVTTSVAEQLESPDSAVTSAFPYPQSSSNYPGVRVPPGWSFSLGFQTYTFTAATRVFYSAAQADGSPLPDWLEFNNQTVTFDGVTPQVPSGTLFNIVLSGSDVFGYSDAQQEFAIVIAAHDLQVVRTPTLNLTLGSTVDTSLTAALSNYLSMDNKPMHADDITSLTLDTSSLGWLTFSPTNYSVHGDVPATQSSASLPLFITDKFGDVLQTVLGVAFFPSAFRASQLTPVIAQFGSPYSLSLGQYLASGVTSATANISATFDPKGASSWLTFSAGDLSLSGTPPKDAQYDAVTITLRAQDQTTNAISTTSLVLSLISNGTTDATRQHAHSHASGGLSRGAVVAIGLIASLVGALILIFAFILRRKQRQVRSPDVEDRDLDGEKWGYEAAETPALEYTEKMGDPATAHMLVGLASTSDTTVINSVPHLPSGKTSTLRSGTAKRSFLSNPFGKKLTKIPPKISNPIIMPSLSNAAFQAQLAAAVDSAGIVNRHSTVYTTHSDLDRSEVTYLDHDERSEGGFTATGTGSDFRSRTPSYISGSEVDRSLAGSKASHRSDITGDTELEVRTTITDDSQFAGAQSSRASWESEPPFMWNNVDTPRAGDGGRSATPSDLSHEAPSASSSASKPKDRSAPVQRADFRAAAQRAPSPPGFSDLSYEGISIDNIHFPTDSDIAHTEASLPSDRDEAVIRTASRIDARRTLDSPATASLASSHTERGASPGPSPVMTTHSRLVSFGKQKKVEVEEAGRSISHTAVLGTTSTAGGSGGVGLGIGVGSSAPKGQGGTATPPLPEPPKAMTRPRAPVPPSRSPSPPSSLPSLPALPTLPSTSSTASRSGKTGKSRAPYANRPQPLAEPQRILLGVSEPFHFYPPLSISPSSSSSTNTTASSSGRPQTRPGAEYIALVERRSSSVGRNKGVPTGGNGPELGELPSWLHFEDGELWGVPGEEDRGEVDVRIVERRGDEERVVGRFSLEVVGR